VRIKKELKKYFQSKIEAQTIPGHLDFLSHAAGPKKMAGSATNLAQSLIFHLAAALLLAFVLLSNSGTTRSLQRIDPDLSKAQAVEHKAKRSLEKIRAYFKPTAAPSNKGGIP
jgi:hypothetical protein